VADFAALYAADLAIVVNPNNPDGRITAREMLLDLARHLHAKGGLLVVDEAFMDVGPQDERVDGDVGGGGLVVLRSFGKFFGLAGVRLGFAIAAEPVALALEAGLGPWAVAGPALEYGIRALADKGWQEAMRGRLQDEAARLDTFLAAFSIRVSGGTSLFRFVNMPDAKSLYLELGAQGIVLRNFTWDASALRIGLPGSEGEWQRLEAALAAWAKRRSPNDAGAHP
jgi:cobalamin biosynthetic protein CobC